MAYTDAQKSQIIKDYVAATPVPDYKLIDPICITIERANGMDYYFPHLNRVFKNGVSEFGLNKVKELYGFDKWTNFNPSDKDRHCPYVKYNDTYGFIEFSSVVTNTKRYDRKSENNLRPPVYTTHKPQFNYYTKQYYSFEDDSGREIHRVFLFNDSLIPWDENGNILWKAHEGKYYNKMFYQFLCKSMCNAYSYGRQNEKADELTRFAKSMGVSETITNFYRFAEFYKNFAPRVSGEKTVKDLEDVLNLDVKNVNKEINDCISTRVPGRVIPIYYSKTDNGFCIRIFDDSKPFDEIRRYYVTKKSKVYSFKVIDGKCSKNTKIAFGIESGAWGTYSTLQGIFINEEEALTDGLFAKYYVPIKKVLAANSYVPFERSSCVAGIPGRAVAITLKTLKDRFISKMIDDGLINLAVDYSAGQNTEFKEKVSVFDSKNPADYKARFKMEEGCLKAIDKYCIPLERGSLFRYTCHYLVKRIGTETMTDSPENLKLINKTCKAMNHAYDVIAKHHIGRGTVTPNTNQIGRFEWDIDKYIYGYYKENCFKRTSNHVYDSITKYVDLWNKETELGELYLKALMAVYARNERERSAWWKKRTGMRFTSSDYGVSTASTKEELERVIKVASETC